MTTFYVSSSKGKDSYEGTTESRPWASLTPVMDGVGNGKITRGDAVLLKSGDTFHQRLSPPDLVRGNRGLLAFGAYGNGSMPVLSGFKRTQRWISAGKSLWKVNLSSSSNSYTGIKTGSANAGFLRAQGKIYSAKKWSLSELKNPWDFYADKDILYVKLDKNPGMVDVAVDSTGYLAPSHSVMSGIRIIGFGGHGVRFASVTNASVHHCLIEYVGGSELTRKNVTRTRYGNGIEVWIGSKDIDVSNNTIRYVYDAAATYQGSVRGAHKAWVNCHIDGNSITRCSQSFEIWSTGAATTGAGFIDTSFNGNRCIDAGRSWSALSRPDQGKGAHILTYRLELPMAGMEIANNDFDGAVDGLFHHVHTTKTNTAGLSMYGNTIHLAPNVPLGDSLRLLGSANRVYTTPSARAAGNVSVALDLLADRTGAALHRQQASAPRFDAAYAPRQTTVLLTSASSDGGFCKVATVEVRRNSGTIGLIMAYQSAGSIDAINRWGFLSLSVSGPGEKQIKRSSVSLNYANDSFPPKGQTRLSDDDWVSVQTVNDGERQRYVVELWFRMIDRRSETLVTPILVHSKDDVGVTWEGISVPGALPSGTQILASFDTPFSSLPITGPSAPDFAPRYIGEEYIDIVNGKVFKATGILDSSDWKCLN